MTPLSYARHRLPPDVIRHAIWLYLRFTFSDRGVEERLAERGLDASYETVRRWVMKFGLQFACNLRARRRGPSGQWHTRKVENDNSDQHVVRFSQTTGHFPPSTRRRLSAQKRHRGAPRTP